MAHRINKDVEKVTGMLNSAVDIHFSSLGVSYSIKFLALKKLFLYITSVVFSNHFYIIKYVILTRGYPWEWNIIGNLIPISSFKLQRCI